MTSANAVRYSGAVAIAGGLLLGVGWIGDPDRLNALFGALIIVGHVLIILAMWWGSTIATAALSAGWAS